MSELHKFDNPDFEQTVDYAFEEAIKTEYKSRYLYVRLSQMFSHIPKVYTFWTDLAQDEEHHARELENIRETLSSEQLIQTADREMLVDIKKVLSFLRGISFGQINNLDDGYELAHELEFSEINSIFVIIATEYVTEEKRREATILQLGHHQKKLIIFNENIGNKAWRKGITSQHYVHQA